MPTGYPGDRAKTVARTIRHRHTPPRSQWLPAPPGARSACSRWRRRTRPAISTCCSSCRTRSPWPAWLIFTPYSATKRADRAASDSGSPRPLTRLVLPVGVAGWVGRFLLPGIAAARGRVEPVWGGVALALSQPLAMAAGLALLPISPLSNTGDYSGAIGHGLVWLALRVALRARHPPKSSDPRSGHRGIVYGCCGD